MKKRRFLTAVLATTAVVLVSCNRADQSTAPEASPSPTETQGAQAAEVSLQMKARNNSSQEGTAVLTATPDGQIKVVIDLTNSPGGPQPSHINRGTCDNLGETVHILGGVRRGKLQATVQASLDSLLAGQFSVNVTKSPQEFGVSVSCAEIKS